VWYVNGFLQASLDTFQTVEEAREVLHFSCHVVLLELQVEDGRV
jgi:hypothetical protein